MAAELTPIEVVEQEMQAHGIRVTQSSAIAFLLGFLIGREWNDDRLADTERLRAWLRRYFESTGRRRKKGA